MNKENHKYAAISSSIFFLILIAFFCILSAPTLYAEPTEKHQNNSLQSSDTNSKSSNSLYQQKYFLIEEDDSSKQQLETFIDIPGFISHWVLDYTNTSLNSEPFFDSINSFHYNSTFGFYPLRSPPSLFF